MFHGPFHYYLLAIFFTVFNGNPYGGILLTFLYGIITIFLGYILGKRLLGHYAGLATSLLIAISPPLISYSRFVWNTHGSTVFILLSFYFLLKTLEKKQKKLRNIFLVSFFAGFSHNFQLAVAIPLSLSIVFSIYLFSKKKELLNLLHFFLVFF